MKALLRCLVQPDELIVANAHLKIREHLIRLVDVLELVLRLLVVDVGPPTVHDVRVVQLRLAKELLLDL